MGTINQQDQEALLARARSAISNALANTLAEDSGVVTSSPELNAHRGCFVTLHVRGRLRGCIGTLQPTGPLADAVSRNACNAAFSDPRFPAVTADELADIQIEVSVLTEPRKIEFTDAEDLKGKLVPGTHGVILRCSGRSAVFLPQVWDQLPDKERFLENLSIKCGLSKHAWKEPGAQVSVYEAEYFSDASEKE
jgi:AmmeMemoRadiSam system protein A